MWSLVVSFETVLRFNNSNLQKWDEVELESTISIIMLNWTRLHVHKCLLIQSNFFTSQPPLHLPFYHEIFFWTPCVIRVEMVTLKLEVTLYFLYNFRRISFTREWKSWSNVENSIWLNLFSLRSHKIMCKLYLNAMENIIEVSLNIWGLWYSGNF